MKSLRLKHEKIISHTPYADGIGVCRDGVSAKPQVFVTGDGWFTYNLAVTNTGNTAFDQANVKLTAEIADGWIPAWFSPYHVDVFKKDLEAGWAKAGKDGKNFEILGGGNVQITNDVKSALQKVKPGAALYIGGMGAKEKNFYNEVFIKYGYADEAKYIQELYLSGRKQEAAEAIPDEFADERLETTLFPTLCSGFTDSVYLRREFGTVAYGFSPFATTPAAVIDAGYHNKDERVHVDDIALSADFHHHAARALLGG